MATSSESSSHLSYPRGGVAQLVVLKTMGVLSSVAPDIAARFCLFFFLRPKKLKWRNYEREALQSATRSSLVLESGRAISLYRWSPNAGGRTEGVLLVHGWEGKGMQLCCFVEPLLQKGYTVFSLDLPAHGDSAGSRTTINECARAITEILEREREITSVVCHSFGALCAVIALAKKRSSVEKLCVIGAPFSLEAVIVRYAKFLGLRSRATQRLLQRIEEILGCPLETLSPEALLPGLTLRGLILHSEDDAEVPVSDASCWAQSMPDAELKVYDDLGHRKILRSEAAIARVSGFLST